jgi:hypothetical protein
LRDFATSLKHKRKEFTFDDLDTIRFVATWSIFEIFLGIFYFSNSKFWTLAVPNRQEPEPVRTGSPGSHGFRPGSHRIG